jgi:cytochrome c5
MNLLSKYSTSRLKAVAVLALLSFATACTYSHGDPVPCNVDPATITYSGVVSPILDRNCRECHAQDVAPTLGGSTSLHAYNDVRAFQNTIVGVIEHRQGFPAMPKDRGKLSDCDIEKIKAWVAAGALNN